MTPSPRVTAGFVTSPELGALLPRNDVHAGQGGAVATGTTEGNCPVELALPRTSAPLFGESPMWQYGYMTPSPTAVDPYAPDTCAVYRLYAADGTLLRVGHTANPKARFGSYAQTAEWWSEVSRWVVDWWPSRADARTEETRLIAERKPRHNIVDNPARDAARQHQRPGGQLFDVVRALRGEKRVRTVVVLGRLSEIDPGTYETWTPGDLAALLRAHGLNTRKYAGNTVVQLSDFSSMLVSTGKGL